MISLNKEIYLDYNETSKYLNCEYRTILNLVSRKKLKPESIDATRKKYISLSNIIKYLKNNNKSENAIKSIEEKIKEASKTDNTIDSSVMSELSSIELLEKFEKGSLEDKLLILSLLAPMFIHMLQEFSDEYIDSNNIKLEKIE